MWSRRLLSAALVSFVLAGSVNGLPPDFADEAIASGWVEPVGLTFAPDDRMFVWEKRGRVWNVENGVKASSPLIDLGEEVGDWRDYGLLGFAIDPDFYSNGFIYLLYVVDYHHLIYFGTKDYDPEANWYFRDTMARLVRYTCNAGDGFHSVDYGSRLVLIGESINSGFPICHQSHGIGTIAFGEDGTLLAGCGDAASYESVDTGTPTSGSSNTCLSDGIISTEEDVGAYRAQLVDSLNGKILRIDPATGLGLPSNPFYEGGDPGSARSRVWALGLRNPYRFSIRPGTGSADPADGDPGTLYIGDVGWFSWEDFNVCKSGGDNFGWPAFEGMEQMSSYYNEDVENLDAPNPLYDTTPPGQDYCAQEFFYFRDLIVQDTLAVPSFPNPCDPNQQVPGSLARFVHTRPAIDWGHGSGPARTGIYDGDDAAVIEIGAPGSPVEGPQFGGSCAVGGAWFTATSFPAEYQGTCFVADFSSRWIRNIVFDENDDPVEVRNFGEEGTPNVVALATDSLEGALYYIAYEENGCCSVRKITWLGGDPVPAASTWGLVIMLFSIAAIGTLVFRRRERLAEVSMTISDRRFRE